MEFSVPAGPPSKPNIDSVSPNAIKISWEKPTDDGGGEIEGYVVEVKPKDGDWSEAFPFEVKETEATVPNLKEGQEYQFRVRAVNAAGPGEPSLPTNPVVAERPAEKPSLDLSRLKDITVKAGQEIKLPVPIKGWPIPTAEWFLNEKELLKAGRINIEVTATQCLLVIKEAERADTGVCLLRLTNPSGSAEGTVNVTVLDRPSPPQGPLEALETSPTAITVQWKPPKDNGGSKLQGYILEKKPKGSKKWSKVPGIILPTETQGTAKNLEPGEEYDFRVMAVNENGESEPLETSESIKAKYPFGEIFVYSNKYVFNILFLLVGA